MRDMAVPRCTRPRRGSHEQCDSGPRPPYISVDARMACRTFTWPAVTVDAGCADSWQ
jgi:hypothetical protein